MKFLPLFALIPFYWSLVWADRVAPSSEIYFVDSAESNLEPMSPNFSRLFDMIMQHTRDAVDFDDLAFNKRDVNEGLKDTLVQLILTVNQSGVIEGVLHEIAQSPEQMNTLSNAIYVSLQKVYTGSMSSHINITTTTNITEILGIVESSGLIYSTFAGLLLDDTQRDMFADSLGEVMVNNTWIPVLLKYVSDNGKITFDTIFDIARNTKSKDPGFNGTRYTKRSIFSTNSSNNDAYSGSLQAFLNNLVGSALSSQLATSSLETILAAVNQSGVVVPTVQGVVRDPLILNMFAYISNKLYNYGVFDVIDINTLYQRLRKDGTLTRLLQELLTSLWSIPLAKIFERWEQRGVYDQVQRNMYGP